MRILVADDEPFVLDLIMKLLGKTSHFAKAVEDGQEAIDAIQADEFDLVITDLQMPKMGGLEVANAVKAKNPTQKVILLTGLGEEGVLPPNVDFILEKPLGINELMSVLVQVGR